MILWPKSFSETTGSNFSLFFLNLLLWPPPALHYYYHHHNYHSYYISKKLTFNKSLHYTPHIQSSLWNILAFQKSLQQTKALIIIFCLLLSPQATHKIQSNGCQPIQAKTGSWKRKLHKRKAEFMQNAGDMRAELRNLHKLAVHRNWSCLNHAPPSFHFNGIWQEVINGDRLPCI